MSAFINLNDCSADMTTIGKTISNPAAVKFVTGFHARYSVTTVELYPTSYISVDGSASDQVISMSEAQEVA